MARWANTSYRYSRPSTPWAVLNSVSDGLEFGTSYDDGLIAEFKARVPQSARRWDPAAKRWLVDTAYGLVCTQLALRFLGIALTVPTITAPAVTETRLLRLEYLGRVKDRDGGERTAFGYVDGGWGAVFPEAALRSWFDPEPQRPGEGRTLYVVLTLKRTATVDEVRSAYRRLARQWHPDVCREPDAAEQFKVITAAYQVLSDDLKRRKYDAGLALAATVRTQTTPSWVCDRGYVPPLRCGWVLAEGTSKLGRFVVDTILQWEDITRDDGKVLVTTWVAGDDKFTSVWR